MFRKQRNPTDPEAVPLPTGFRVATDRPHRASPCVCADQRRPVSRHPVRRARNAGFRARHVAPPGDRGVEPTRDESPGSLGQLVVGSRTGRSGADPAPSPGRALVDVSHRDSSLDRVSSSSAQRAPLDSRLPRFDDGVGLPPRSPQSGRVPGNRAAGRRACRAPGFYGTFHAGHVSGALSSPRARTVSDHLQRLRRVRLHAPQSRALQSR